MTPIPKPCRAARKAAQARQQRQSHRTRAQVRQIVFRRAKGCCERCHVPVSFDVYAGTMRREKGQAA